MERKPTYLESGPASTGLPSTHPKPPLNVLVIHCRTYASCQCTDCCQERSQRRRTQRTHDRQPALRLLLRSYRAPTIASLSQGLPNLKPHLSPTITRPPRRTIASHVARPSPDPAPVTTNTLPSTFIAADESLHAWPVPRLPIELIVHARRATRALSKRPTPTNGVRFGTCSLCIQYVLPIPLRYSERFSARAPSGVFY